MKPKPLQKPSTKWWIVEKKDRHALHGIFSSEDGAKRCLREDYPISCARGLFMDKTLKPDSFIVIPAPRH